MEYGGFWRRVLAYIIDGIILNIASGLVGFVLGLGWGFAGGGEESATYLGGAVGFLIGLLYFALMESSTKQATLGKMALGMIVTDENGGRISFLRAIGRYLGKILSTLILLIGFIMVAFTERKQGLHDMIASTLVVKGQPGMVGADPDVFA